MQIKKCALCSEEASGQGPLCIVCMSDSDGVKYFVTQKQNFTIYLKSGGMMKPFKTEYDTLGLIIPGSIIIYISEYTGNLLIGQITSNQSPTLESINVRRITRSNQKTLKGFDNIQYDEIACVLLDR